MRIRSDHLELDLADGRRIIVPLTFYPTLRRATAPQRRAWEFWPFATALEWPELDLQLSVRSIVAGLREHLPPAGFADRTRRDAAAAGLRAPMSTEKRFKRAG